MGTPNRNRTLKKTNSRLLVDICYGRDVYTYLVGMFSFYSYRALGELSLRPGPSLGVGEVPVRVVVGSTKPIQPHFACVWDLVDWIACLPLPAPSAL